MTLKPIEIKRLKSTGLDNGLSRVLSPEQPSPSPRLSPWHLRPSPSHSPQNWDSSQGPVLCPPALIQCLVVINDKDQHFTFQNFSGDSGEFYP